MPLCGSRCVPSPWRLCPEFISPNVPRSVRTERRHHPPQAPWCVAALVRGDGVAVLLGRHTDRPQTRPAHPQEAALPARLRARALVMSVHVTAGVVVLGTVALPRCVCTHSPFSATPAN